MKFLVATSILAAAAVSTVDAAGTGTFFTYFEDGGLGPSNWAFLGMDNNQCGGTQGASGYGQSPVTISKDVSGTCDTDMSAYTFAGGDCLWADLTFGISNTGVVVSKKADSTCSFGQMTIPHTPNKFNALQFHIHTYSEHEIVGQGRNGFFPAELHVVHQEDLETGASYAVFGTMIEVGTEDHAVFEWFLQGWEAYAQSIEDSCTAATGRRQLRSLEETAFQPVQGKVQCPKIGESVIFNSTTLTPNFPAGDAPNVYELPTDKDFGIFTYKGGLTTPGCTEIVNWNLLDRAMKISDRQLKRLEKLVLCYVQQVKDADENVKSCNHATVADLAGSTSRPPQPLLGRKVSHRCRDGPAVEYVDIGVLPMAKTSFVKPVPRSEPANTKEARCERSMYEDCPSDPRYNPSISPNLKSVAPIWNDVEGYWIGTKRSFNAQGNPLEEVFASSEFTNTLPYPQSEIQLFVNRTVQETRYYEHSYFVYQPARSEFCSLPVPDFASNKRGAGECGINGYARENDVFGTASFEKDGATVVIMANGVTEGAMTGNYIPVGSSSFYENLESETFHKVETSTFSNEERTLMTGSGQYLIFSDELPYSENPLYETYTFVLQQVSKETWEAELAAAYEKANILDEDRPPLVEGSDNCVYEGFCPSEEMFAKTDPAIAESPFKEDPKIKGGFIALFVIVCAAVVFGGAFAFHKSQIDSQAARYRDLFAKRIAETIEFSGKHDQLTPEALEDEFRRMDVDKDGQLSKAELQQFMGDKMSQKDFDAMFIAMDIDHSGTVEFAEFCSFMAHFFSAYDKASAAIPARAAAAPKTEEEAPAEAKAEAKATPDAEEHVDC